MRVIIVGMGDVGVELARELLRLKSNELVIVDIDPNLCSALADEFDALVIQGDGTHPDILEKAQIGRADALVATTGSDALNTVIVMLARSYNVRHIVVKLVDLALRPACRQIGATRIVAPAIAAAFEIRAALFGSHQLDLSVAARGGALLVEADADATVGTRVDRLHLPAGTWLVAVIRGEAVLIPREDLVVQPRDVLLCLVEGSGGPEALRRHLAGAPPP